MVLLSLQHEPDISRSPSLQLCDILCFVSNNLNAILVSPVVMLSWCIQHRLKLCGHISRVFIIALISYLHRLFVRVRFHHVLASSSFAVMYRLVMHSYHRRSRHVHYDCIVFMSLQPCHAMRCRWFRSTFDRVINWNLQCKLLYLSVTGIKSRMLIFKKINSNVSFPQILAIQLRPWCGNIVEIIYMEKSNHNVRIRLHSPRIAWNHPTTTANGVLHSRRKSISMSKTTDNI